MNKWCRMSGSAKQRLRTNGTLYLLLLPAILFYAIFHYAPMGGVAIAFQDYNLFKGMAASPWVGFKHFQNFFSSIYFGRLIKNTLLLNIYTIIFSFPVPILFALLLSEIRFEKSKKLIQSFCCIPHFLSVVVLCSILSMIFSPTYGIAGRLQQLAGSTTPVNYIKTNDWFRTIYISSGIWQNTGWNSLVFYSAILNIDPSLHEAAIIDGATRRQRARYITIPTIMPTIIMMLLLSVGRIMNVGFEKVYLLQTPSTYEVSDVISTYVYRMGLTQNQFSFASAVGLFNSIVSLLIVGISNFASNKFSETSLW